MNKVLFSSDRDDWETTPDRFAALNEEFHFTLKDSLRKEMDRL